jgi:hypothetical protein
MLIHTVAATVRFLCPGSTPCRSQLATPVRIWRVAHTPFASKMPSLSRHFLTGNCQIPSPHFHYPGIHGLSKAPMSVASQRKCLDIATSGLTRRTHMSWHGFKSRLFGFGSNSAASEEWAPDGDDDAVRGAILEKALKGRQPADLLLRCESISPHPGVLFHPSHCVSRYCARCGR